MTSRIISVALLVVFATASPATAQADPYETYVKTSRGFQGVTQDKAWRLQAFPSWTYMPK